MNRKYILPSLTILTAFGTSAETPKAGALDLSGYKLVWSDEFDGTALDREVWKPEDNGTGCCNHELEHYIDSPEVCSVSDGVLHLTARRQKCKCGAHEFVSARLSTNTKFNFQYGVVQAAIKLPETANGLWPAFWMMGDDIGEEGWPRCGEIDILEMGHANGIAAGQSSQLFNGALHWGPGEHHSETGASTAPYSLQDGKYHIYTLVWTPECIEMYLDDLQEPYLHKNIAENPDDPASPAQYFHKPNFLLLNLAVGGDFPGIHDADKVSALAEGPRSMEVDYIRLYQKN